MPSLRVVQYPRFASNPHQALLAQALAAQGVETGFAETLTQLLRRVLARSADVVHIHWTHPPSGLGRPAMLARLGVYCVTLSVARLLRVGIVWTVHNAKAHEGEHPHIDQMYAAATGALAHRVIVQGPTGAGIAAADFNVARDKIATIKHPNYAPIFDPCEPAAGDGPRRFLAWGQIRAYKGFAALAAAFAELGQEAELVIAGSPKDGAEVDRLRAIAAGSPRVTVRSEYLEETELNREICRAHFVVLPYRDVLTSGALLMSLTVGRPVIVPRIGDLAAYVDEESAIFYDPDDALGVLRAIEQACALDAGAVERMSHAARLAGEAQPLEAAARATREEYRLAAISSGGRDFSQGGGTSPRAAQRLGEPAA